MRAPSIELIVRVTDGSFESRLSVPVDAPKDQHVAFAQMWLDALGQAVKLTAPQSESEQKNGREE